MTLAEFKKLNAEKGLHWFSEGTMSFFQSKIEYWNDSGWFITSEVDPSGTKKFSVRSADFETGQVSTVGKFHSYDDLNEAKQAGKAS